MNKELKDRIFKVPKEILDKISKTMTGLSGKHVYGIDRAEKILLDKSVNYGQLKKIIHDMENMDPQTDMLKYQLAGGDMMLRWGKTYLNQERELIKKRKEARKRADEIGGIDGDRQNNFNKNHKKRFSVSTPLNMMKSNSHKSSISSLNSSLKLFEDINRIKRLL